jgi:hypothetical protein
MAALKQKVFLVTANGEEFLVRALTKISALHFIAARTIDAEIASADALVRLTKAGQEIENAKEQAAALTLPLPLEPEPATATGDLQPALPRKPAGSKARR